MADAFWESYWANKKAARERLRQAGGITVKVVSSRLHVATPYSDEFLAGARELGGRWRKRSHVWSFSVNAEPAVRALVESIWPGKWPRRQEEQV